MNDNPYNDHRARTSDRAPGFLGTIVIVVLLVLILWAGTTDEKHQPSPKQATIDPCALVLDQSGQRCR